MKLQLEKQQLRLRISEGELAGLLAGETLRAETCLGAALSLRYQVVLEDAAQQASIGGGPGDWHFRLPEAPIVELSRRLPSRDGIRFQISATPKEMLELRFDIDLHS